MEALLVSLLTFSTLSLEPGYASIGRRDGVDVYLRKDAALIELAAIGELDAPPAEVLEALVDYGAHPRFNRRLAESTVLRRRPGELLVYQYLKLPVIKDRDFTLRVTFGDGRVRFHVDERAGPPPTAKAVRVGTLTGGWDLQPIRGGRATRAVYRLRLDFAGAVPRWMVRGGAVKDLPVLYEGLGRLIVERRRLSRR